MARSISDALLAAQVAPSNTPYIRIYINSVDYSSRLLALEHHEEAYRDRAVIILRNDDLALSSVDFTGQQFKIGYGHVTASNEYSETADLWVKNQLFTSAPGQQVCQLYAEGMWMRLREQRIMAGVTGSQPFYDNTFNATNTVYSLIELVIENAMSWTLSAFAGAQDGIINTFQPIFDINQMPYENGATVLYRLLWMTKCYLRAKAGTTFELVYPQTSDSADETYYSDQAHYFMEYTEKVSLLIPNSIVVMCNAGLDGLWTNIITGTAEDATEIAKYYEILQPFMAASITDQDDANRRAAAILTRLKAETLAGRLVVPHDARVELYDKVQVVDTRGL